MAYRVLKMAFSHRFACQTCFRSLLKRNMCSTTKNPSQTTVNQSEVNKFNSLNDNWWDPNSWILHGFNNLRVPLIRDGLLANFISDQAFKRSKPLEGFSIVDVGCGGGILCEPLARLGATVTGIDPGPENISVAVKHAALDKDIQHNLNYMCMTIEDLANQPKQFDAVVCSEVIEHVENVPLFLQSCVKLVKNGGSLFFTTPNRTILSGMFVIFMSEYIFRIVPRGTHEWKKFIHHDELCKMLESNNCRVVLVNGVLMNPTTYKWWWSNNKSCLYAVHAIKEA